MNLEVTFRNISPREEVRRRAEALYKKMHRFLDPSADGQLTVGIAHGQPSVELVVFSKGQTHKMSEQDMDLRTALDRLMHGMENQLRRAKERRVARRRTGEMPEPIDPLAPEQ